MSQPIRFEYDLTNCSVRRALDVLGEKWTLLIVREAMYGVRRFEDFARSIPCGRGVLSQRLKTLVSAGIVLRTHYREKNQRRRSEYYLTEMGQALFPVVLALSQWGDRWMPPPGGPATVVTESKSGRSVKVIMTSDRNVRALTMQDLAVAPGSGAKKRTRRLP